MFHLARGYSQAGMTAYSRLQQEEFAAQELGYRAVTHQRFVGTGYFDEIAQVVSSGNSSTTALCRLDGNRTVSRRRSNCAVEWADIRSARLTAGRHPNSALPPRSPPRLAFGGA